MAIEIEVRSAGGSGGSAGVRRDGVVGVALMLGSALSNQSGAAIGALAFPVVGPVAVVAIRQWVAGVILLAVGRPRLRAFSRKQWVLVVGLAGVFAAMNLSLYVAIRRVGLGLAVTLEFLGPLTVALAGSVGATSRGGRRRAILGCALLAGAGVLLLTRPGPTTDYLGLGFGVLAAACWAGYILLNRTASECFSGIEGSAAASAVSALLYVPIGIATLVMHPLTSAALVCAATAGLLASVVPFVADLLALRRVPVPLYGIFMSVNPVIAAGIGALVLGDTLRELDCLAIALIITANVAGLLVTSMHSQTFPRQARSATVGAAVHTP